MTALGLRRATVLVTVAMLLEPWGVHRTRVDRLQPGAAQCRRSQQQDESQEPGTAQEPDHRRPN